MDYGLVQSIKDGLIDVVAYSLEQTVLLGK
jgi:hypothetical protein